MMFALGFVVAVFLMVVVSRSCINYALKKGWYASAVWSEKEKIWKVSGNYLSIGNKIFRGIQHENLTGEKKVKYVK